MNALIYDVEIQRCIPDRNGTTAEINPVTGQPYLFCDGWHDHKGMGVACVCVWDCLENVPWVFSGSESDIADLNELIQLRQLVIGFNTIGFDNKVLAANRCHIPEWKCFDIYAEVIKAEGLPADRPHDGGRSVDHFAAVNFGMQKSAHGAEAPKMFQRGELAALYSYCLRDVMLERRLWMRAIEGTLIHPRTRQVIELPIPEGFKKK